MRAESFADTALPAGTFDAVIGNVPFANVRLTDPVHNQGGHAMHNHFILKSLALTKPGGTVAVLTSRYTLDAQNPAARGPSPSRPCCWARCACPPAPTSAPQALRS